MIPSGEEDKIECIGHWDLYDDSVNLEDFIGFYESNSDKKYFSFTDEFFARSIQDPNLFSKKEKKSTKLFSRITNFTISTINNILKTIIMCSPSPPPLKKKR